MSAMAVIIGVIAVATVLWIVGRHGAGSHGNDVPETGYGDSASCIDSSSSDCTDSAGDGGSCDGGGDGGGD